MRTHQIKAFDAGGSREIKKTRLGAEENQTQIEQRRRISPLILTFGFFFLKFLLISGKPKSVQ